MPYLRTNHRSWRASRSDVERARRLLRTTPTLSARDAVHIALMQGRDIDRILTFDTGFDGIPGIVRLG